MNKIKASLIILIFASIALIGMRKEPRGLSIEISHCLIADKSLRINLKIQNDSEDSIKMWDLRGEPGAYTLSFDLHDPSGSRVRFLRLPLQSDGGGVPPTVVISPGGSLTYEYDLFDGSWVLPSYVGAGKARKISANLDSCGGGLVNKNNVFSGHVESGNFDMGKEYLRTNHFVYLQYTN